MLEAAEKLEFERAAALVTNSKNLKTSTTRKIATVA